MNEAKIQVSFNDLPIELELKIFSLLDHETLEKASLVNKHWKEITEDPTLWRKVFLPDSYTKERVNNVLKRTSLLHTLRLRASPHVEVIAACSTNLRFLKNLDIAFSLLCKTSNIFTIVENCKLLEDFNCEGCEGIDDQCISELVTLPKLHSLNISHCRHVTDAGIILIGDSTSNLSKLFIEGITQITDEAIVNLCLKRNDTLIKLKLDGEELTITSFTHLQNCHKLKLLAIPFSVGLSDEGLKSVQLLNKLEWLQINKGNMLSSNGLTQFFMTENLHNLVFLDIESGHMSDDAVEKLVKCCPLLQNLYLCWCWEVTERGLQMIVSHLFLLRHLDVTGMFHVTGHCLVEIPEKLPSLCFLNLQQCNNIEDSLLPDIVERQSHLRIINYYGELVMASSLL